MKKLIDLHKEWAKKKYLSSIGLCNSVPEKYRELLELLEPTTADIKKLEDEEMSTAYWASGYEFSQSSMFDRAYRYTSLRQTIVLFICAMKGEI